MPTKEICPRRSVRMIQEPYPPSQCSRRKKSSWAYAGEAPEQNADPGGGEVEGGIGLRQHVDPSVWPPIRYPRKRGQALCGSVCMARFFKAEDGAVLARIFQWLAADIDEGRRQVSPNDAGTLDRCEVPLEKLAKSSAAGEQ